MEDANIQSKGLMSSKEIIKNARKFYKDNFKKFWLLYILGGLGGMSFNYSRSGDFKSILQHINIPLWSWTLIGVVLAVIYIFLFISRISLLKGISDVHNGQFVGVKDSYKKGFAILWSFVLITIMIALSCFGAFVLLIIPGIILSEYLFFSIYELIDKKKTGFQALLGSWALVSGNWWELFGKLLMIGLRIVLLGLFYAVIILIPTLLLFVPGMIFHILALSIAGAMLGAIAFLYLVFAFLAPLSIIAMFELYYNFCEIKAVSQTTDETLNKKRKRKLKISMIIGIIVIPLIVIATSILLISSSLPRS